MFFGSFNQASHVVYVFLQHFNSLLIYFLELLLSKLSVFIHDLFTFWNDLRILDECIWVFLHLVITLGFFIRIWIWVWIKSVWANLCIIKLFQMTESFVKWIELMEKFFDQLKFLRHEDVLQELCLLLQVSLQVWGGYFIFVYFHLEFALRFFSLIFLFLDVYWYELFCFYLFLFCKLLDEDNCRSEFLCLFHYSDICGDKLSVLSQWCFKWHLLCPFLPVSFFYLSSCVFFIQSIQFSQLHFSVQKAFFRISFHLTAVVPYFNDWVLRDMLESCA